MKQFILFICLLWMQHSAVGKNKIEGTIVDISTHSNVSYATVALMSSDSILISGSTTDLSGKFEINNVKDGDFVLRISYIGYDGLSITIRNLKSDLSLGKIELTPHNVQLSEVTITASSVLKKTDRQIVLPTEKQRKASSNGFTLLQNLQLSKLLINPINNSVTISGGGNVQLRINGRETTHSEVIALQPKDILRIEYLDNPGLRYGNTCAVINYIVRHNKKGGNVSGDFTNGVSLLGYGEYNISAKYNTNTSELSAVLAMEQRNFKWIRENYETLNLPDNVINNIEIGYPTKIKYADLNFILNYNYYHHENKMLSITLSDKINDMPNSISDRESQLIQGTESYLVSDKTSSKTNIPSIDIYYQQSLKNKQKLYIDVVGTYLKSKSSKLFRMANANHSNEITSTVNGKKYSIIAEGIYEKTSEKGTLTAGIKQTQSFLTNRYNGDTNTTIDMTISETYAFGEWQSSFKGLNFKIGLGAMNTYNQQDDLSQSKLICRPSLSLSYSIDKHWFLRYNSYVSSYAPSLADLNNVTQTIDTYQKKKGNPDLRAVTFYANTLSASFSGRNASIELFGRYSYDNRPIMESSYLEDNYVIRTSENQRSFHRLNLSSTFTLSPWKEYLTIRLAPFMNRYISHGNDYIHTHTNYGFRGSLMAMYKNWALLAEMNTSEHVLWGETLSKEEKSHSIKIGYNAERWSVGASAINPFTKRYQQETCNLSKIAQNILHAYSNNLSPFFMVNISFNLDFGKNNQRQNKRINNKDTDFGILVGKK